MFGPKPISPRRVWNLISWLPDGSATARDADWPTAWTIAEHVAVSTLEVLQETNVLLLKAHFKPTGQEPRVTRLPRPGASKPVAPTIDDFLRQFVKPREVTDA